MFTDKPLCQFRQGHVAIGINPCNQDVAIGCQRAASVPLPTGRPCRAGASDPACALRFARRTAVAALTPNRRAAPGPAICNRFVNPSPKIGRICFAHNPPPVRVNHNSDPLEIHRLRFSAGRSRGSEAYLPPFATPQRGRERQQLGGERTVRKFWRTGQSRHCWSQVRSGPIIPDGALGRG